MDSGDGRETEDEALLGNGIFLIHFVYLKGCI